MKAGTTFFIFVKTSELDMSYVSEVVFTIKSRQNTLTKNGIYEDGNFKIPLTQEETLSLVGSCLIEGQINFTNKSVAKTETKYFNIDETLATKIVSENYPSDAGSEVELEIVGDFIAISGGEGGVGIQSIEQTTTSEESGGINIVTVTLTNGNVSEFQIKNGEQGAQGETGPQGEQGAQGEQGIAGKSAYEYAQDGGYIGTEEEFAVKLASEITVDDALSEESENPVQNKVVTKKFSQLSQENVEQQKTIDAQQERFDDFKNEFEKTLLTKNLYTGLEEVEGYMGADGVVKPNASWATSDYIDVHGLEAVCCSRYSGDDSYPRTNNAFYYFATYDSDKNYIESKMDYNSNVYTIEEGVHYIRFSHSVNSVDIMVESGTTISNAYEPYEYEVTIKESPYITVEYLESKNPLALGSSFAPSVHPISFGSLADGWVNDDSGAANPPIEDTEDYFLGTCSLNSNENMRIRLSNPIDLVENELYLSVKINSIADGARLLVYIGENGSFSTKAEYTIHIQTEDTFFKVGEWVHITIPTYGFLNDQTNLPNFRNINMIMLKPYGGSADWNLQLLGYRKKQLKRGIVSFTFDDGFKSQLTGAKVLAEKGISSTIYFMHDTLDDERFFNLDDCKKFVNLYHGDLEVHGYSKITDLTEEELITHWSTSQEWMKNNGLSKGEHLAYPNGQFDIERSALAKRFFKSCRTIADYEPLESYNAPMPDRLRAISSIYSTDASMTRAKNLIKRAMDSNAWLILVFHEVVAESDASSGITESDLGILADYAIEQGAYIMNIRDVFESRLAIID